MSNRKQAERKLKQPPRPRTEIEKELQEEKAVRQQEYSEKINALLKDGNCGLVTVVQFGDVEVASNVVLALPHRIVVVAN